MSTARGKRIEGEGKEDPLTLDSAHVGIKVKVEMEVEISHHWIEHVTGVYKSRFGYADVFSSDYSGYWMRGMKSSEKGWLAYEHGDDKLPSEKECERVIALWEKGDYDLPGHSLPKGWHVLDLECAKRGWQEGVKRWGPNWFEDGDGVSYDVALQLALGVTWVHDGITDPRYG